MDVNIKFCHQSMHYMNVNTGDIISVYLFTGFEDKSKFIVPEKATISWAKLNEIVAVEVDNKLSIVQTGSK